MFLHIRLARAQTLIRTMTSPIKQTSESPSNQSHWQAFGESKEKHAQTGAKEPSQQHFLSPDPVTQATPENATDAFHKCERRCDHAGVHGNLGIVFCDVERFDHEVGVRED